jgi:hypothetical protein
LAGLALTPDADWLSMYVTILRTNSLQGDACADFSSLVKSADSRSKFAATLAKARKQYGFDALSIDWEVRPFGQAPSA